MAEPLTTTLAQVVDDAISRGVEFHMDDPRNTSVVMVKIPRGYSAEDNQRLKELRAPIRLLIKLRTLSEWLTRDQQQLLHGESDVSPDEYGKWIVAVAGGDRLIRFIYGFEGCLFGDRGCGDAVVRCENCAGGA